MELTLPPFCLLSEREKSNWDLKEIYLLLLRNIRDVEEGPNSLLFLQLMKASKVWYQENELENREIAAGGLVLLPIGCVLEHDRFPL